VVVFQVNAIDVGEPASTEGTLLTPERGWGTRHHVVSWRSANPVAIGPIAIEGIPDHGFVAVVAASDGTRVTVTAGAEIIAGGSVAAFAAGATRAITLDAMDVLNLESGDSGDLSGTRITSSEPVLVFSGAEGATAPIDTASTPGHPSGSSDTCCSDHLEEVAPSDGELGDGYVLAISPRRSTHATWREPDVYRVMAAGGARTVTTNLPAPNDSFSLSEGELRTLHVTAPAVLEADGNVVVEQVLVGANWVVDAPADSGDPANLMLAPLGRFGRELLLVQPDTVDTRRVVIVTRDDGTVRVNGEAATGCLETPAGSLSGVSYTQLDCPTTSDVTTISADQPSMAYGYAYGPFVGIAYRAAVVVR
jgi:hypothetical protein